MLNDQRVFVATACGGQQDRFPQQGGRVDQVKQVFKKSRVSALVDGAADDQKTSWRMIGVVSLSTSLE